MPIFPLLITNKDVHQLMPIGKDGKEARCPIGAVPVASAVQGLQAAFLTTGCACLHADTSGTNSTLCEALIAIGRGIVLEATAFTWWFTKTFDRVGVETKAN
mmetsp:Transcript_10997/g.33724  ORF Transcript_10997/g.33724 Transcript_10997/m.33724 type:complete len:102 (-) Transcript_10997:1327-1632(-)